MPPDTEWEFRLDVPVVADTSTVPFEAEDAAGNITRGEMTLASGAGGQPGIREGTRDVHGLPRWAFRDPGSVLADLVVGRAAAARPTLPDDRDAPVITLISPADQETVYADSVYLEVKVTDASAITAFTINGTSLWRRPSPQLFVGHKFPLHEGDNHFVLEAVDTRGNAARRDLVVRHVVQKARQLDARLRVALLPFEPKGVPSLLAETVPDSLLDVLVSQRRFQFIERTRLETIFDELKLNRTALVDPKTAVQVGKLAVAEGSLFGTVSETVSAASHALDVYMRLVDVETTAIVATANVYGEDQTLVTLKTLMEGLAWKLQRQFPLAEGLIVDRQGKHLLTDLSRQHGVRQAMKLVVFRDGATRKHPSTGKPMHEPERLLGEARITAVSDDLSEALWLPSVSPQGVQKFDRVITK